MQANTQEAMIERGMRAARILENEDIMSFFEEQKAIIKDCLFNTDPEDSKGRDTLFYQHMGVEQFIQTLVAYQTAATRILEASTAEDLKEDD